MLSPPKAGVFLLALTLAILVFFAGRAYPSDKEVDAVYEWFCEQAPQVPRGELFKYASVLVNECRYQVVPVDIMSALLVHESGLNWRARSRVGAIGLAQIMPVWIPELKRRGLTFRSLYDPEANIKAGVIIFAHYLGKTHGNVDKALAMYNAGPNKPHLGKSYATRVLSLAKTI